MRRLAKRLLIDRSGTTAIEYALIGTLVAVAIVATVGAVGQQVVALFAKVAAAFG